MATDKLIDDVDPSHREPTGRERCMAKFNNVANFKGTPEPLSVDGAAALRFPDRPLYDNQIRTFDDREVAALHDQTYEPAEIVIELTVADQRKIIEHQVGGPVFRMWMSKDEWDRVKPVQDWTAYELSDGRIAVWRKRSELDVIMTKNLSLWSSICQRIIEDDVI